MDKGFQPDTLEVLLAPLDDLARSLWLPALATACGSLPVRLAGVCALRDALEEGLLPVDGCAGWMPAAIATPFLRAVRQLNLPAYGRANAEVAEQVVKSLLWHINRVPELQDRCGESRERAAERAAAAFVDDWQETAADFDEVLRVFEDLGDLAQFAHWADVRGLLRSEHWQELVRVSGLVAGLAELRRLIQSLGRSRPVECWGDSLAELSERKERVREVAAQQRELRLPHVPCETHGLKRSGDLARMLPGESVLMGHPRLRALWHAHLIERTLLTYDDEDASVETVMVETDTWRRRLVPAPGKKLEMGPMIVCVDTSGSMAGAPEQVAKGIVLEAMRSANRQRRPCYVYAFGGPGEMLEYELGANAGGLGRLLEFMGQRFGGGTDIADTVEHAIDRLAERRWERADLLIASDGEFGCTPAVAARIRDAKTGLGLCIQGLLIGDRETIGMREVCDAIWWLQDWRRYGSKGAAAESPVPTKSLTAMYFPGALRDPPRG